MAIHAQKGRGSPSTPATQASMEIRAPSAHGEGRGWCQASRPGASPGRQEVLRWPGEAPACRNRFPTSWRGPRPLGSHSDELERPQAVGKPFRRAGEAPGRREAIPTSWRGPRPSGSYSDGLERPQAVRKLLRRPGEAPGRRSSFPTSWRGYRPSGSHSDELERPQAVRKLLRLSSSSKWLPDGLGPLQLVGIAIPTSWSLSRPAGLTPTTPLSQLGRGSPSTPAMQASMAVHAFFGVDAVIQGRQFSAPLDLWKDEHRCDRSFLEQVKLIQIFKEPSRVMKEQRGLAHSFTLDCFSPTLDDDVQAIVTDEQILYPFSQNPDKTISHQHQKLKA
ncbi:hypothetical protein PSTG_05718 [Puccinia striiformis f. sp. tritici PST-78]|uniref:Uncharacterized protein n=1 Tax=Puccinia striiformis f. sp. tritici PST-78 TaxID=1165861 RepID=A0A0L0VP86_9BASI|nr:hypothetical protein PSTG_05718 [Puccinia striiformis f. sp. tritici PST-78]